MIHVLYTTLNKAFQAQNFEAHLATLPKDMQHKIKRYRRWQDQQATLLGKLLLRKGMQQLNCTEDPLFNLQYNTYGKPFIPKFPDFNISHSGAYVLCAISTNGTIGVDIEHIKPVDPENFKTQMVPAEWKQIATALHPIAAFYTYWTQKEAVIKAAGKGLSIPLDSFMIIDHTTRIEKQDWYTTPISIHSDYLCHLATPQKTPFETVQIDQIVFN